MQLSKLSLMLAWTVGASLALVGLQGCTKQETEVTPPAVTPSPANPSTGQKPSTHQTGSTVPLTQLAPNSKPATPAAPVEDFDKMSPPQQLQYLAKMEGAYQASADLSTKIHILYDISGTGAPAALDSITRMFQAETDSEMKQQMIDSLDDVDGENDRKLMVLTAGIQSNQPQEVRESAIDSLVDLEDARAIAILQGLLNDSNADIREAAQDAIDQLKELMSANSN